MSFSEISIGPMGLSIAGSVVVWGGFELRDRARRMNAWRSVRGTVTGSAVVADGTFDDGSTAYRPRIRYKYVVAEQEYSGQRRSLINVGVGFFLRGAAQRIVDRYPVGSEVIVFYDPANPGEAILERPDPVAGPGLLFALGAGLVAGGPLWAWWVHR